MSGARVELRAAPAARVTRHALPDRLFHWVTAAAVLTLLATAFLPVVGVRFPWLGLHWAAGWVLIAALLFHLVRSLSVQEFARVWFGRADFRDIAAIIRFSSRRTLTPPPKPGKYSPAQKLIHWLFATVLTASAVTGGFMMVKIDTPWWHRHPYWLADGTWGLVYVVHDLAALMLVTMVIAHVYFALRPEKLAFTRAMVTGSMSREEFLEHHDPERWRVPNEH